MKDFNRLIHEVLQSKFRTLLDEEASLRHVIYQILAEGTAYLIGGYIRDVFEGRLSRDLDIVVDIPTIRLREIIDEEVCHKIYNRLGGAKLLLSNTNVDIWSFDNNWAFKNELVKLNENEKLNSLAKGCFYNYDALVVNIFNFSYNTRFYESFNAKKELDILQKRTIYKKLNPTPEANILRAIFIKKTYQVEFSDQLKQYIYIKSLALNDYYGDVTERLIKIKESYPKYSNVDREDIIGTFEELKKLMPQTLF